MFSYKINNPNNKIIKYDNCYIIPIGHRCATSLACIYAQIRKFSLPFDWGIPWYPNTIQKILENDFKDFCNFKGNGYIYNPTYNFGSEHFNNDINVLVNTFERRIERFNNIINEQKKIYFIYINEDFLYNKNHREDMYCDKIFNELLELEIFLKKKYVNIDYNILYFDCKEHNIPTSSNIINIVLHSNTLYEKSVDSPYGEFRIYCGKILSELFGTSLKLNIKIDQTIFHKD